MKLSTKEFPLHEGDIALDPTSEYVLVEPTDSPEHDIKTHICTLGKPVNENDVWKMTWIVRERTEEELGFLKMMEL